MRARTSSPERVLLQAAFAAGRRLDHRRAAELLGITTRNAREHLQGMHDAAEVHIARWGHSGRGPWFPIYEGGEGEDAPYPDVRQEYARRRRDRRRIRQGPIAALLGV